MNTILVTGGTGLIGMTLTDKLIKTGKKVIILTRTPEKFKSNQTGLSFAKWDIEKKEIDVNAIAQSDCIIHLAGASVAEKRWTAKRKQEIINSRVQSSELIVKALKEIPNNVKTVISASATGWYGADKKGEGAHAPFTETDLPADDFLGTTCKLWEESIQPVENLKIRLVKLRIGIVLSNDGGAIKEFKKPLRFGLAAILGSGKQKISWIHIDDLVNLISYAIENKSLDGIYNAVSPLPVSNKELIMQLAKACNRFYIPFHVPAFILKIVFGEMSIEILKSTTASSSKTENAGFHFTCPSITDAMQNLTIAK